jgi:hypothetical protein
MTEPVNCLLAFGLWVVLVTCSFSLEVPRFVMDTRAHDSLRLLETAHGEAKARRARQAACAEDHKAKLTAFLAAKAALEKAETELQEAEDCVREAEAHHEHALTNHVREVQTVFGLNAK